MRVFSREKKNKKIKDKGQLGQKSPSVKGLFVGKGRGREGNGREA